MEESPRMSTFFVFFFSLSGSGEQREGKQTSRAQTPRILGSSWRPGEHGRRLRLTRGWNGDFLAPLRLWIPLARSFSRVSRSPFSAPPPASSSPRHQLVFLSLPPPTIRSSPSAFIPLHTFALTPNLFAYFFFFCLFIFCLPLLTAGSACVNICAGPPVCPSGDAVGGVCHRSASRRSSPRTNFAEFSG